MSSPNIAVIGGSGLYRFLTPTRSLTPDTPFGRPSAPITLVDVDGPSVAFLPRHGTAHTLPPHRINYRANIHALHQLGVERVIAPSAVGSLHAQFAPGDLVICDQFIDRTWGRASTFFDGPAVAHVEMASPYCDELRPLATVAGHDAGFTVHTEGTVMVVQGPRFGTRAESIMHRAMGADVINMTQYPEVALARELGICYVNISLVTDYDAGLQDSPEIEHVTQERVFSVFEQSVERLQRLLVLLVKAVPAERACGCAAGTARPLRSD